MLARSNSSAEGDSRRSTHASGTPSEDENFDHLGIVFFLNAMPHDESLAGLNPVWLGDRAHLHGLVKAATKAGAQHRSFFRLNPEVGVGLPQQQRKRLVRRRSATSGTRSPCLGHLHLWVLSHSAAGLVLPWAVIRRHLDLVQLPDECGVQFAQASSMHLLELIQDKIGADGRVDIGPLVAEAPTPTSLSSTAPLSRGSTRRGLALRRPAGATRRPRRGSLAAPRGSSPPVAAPMRLIGAAPAPLLALRRVPPGQGRAPLICFAHDLASGTKCELRGCSNQHLDTTDPSASTSCARRGRGGADLGVASPPGARAGGTSSS